MSEGIKLEHEEDCYTVLDEVEDEEGEVTFEDNSSKLQKDDTDVLFANEEKGLLNAEDISNNILGELDELLNSQNDTDQQEENKIMEQDLPDDGNDPVAAAASVSKDGDKGVCELSASVETNSEDPNGDICQPANMSEAETDADKSQVEVIEVPDDPIEDEEDPTDSDKTHPYLYLIETFEYQKDQLNLTPVEEPKSIEQSRCQIILNKNPFMKMISTLRNEKEISVSYYIPKGDPQGIICLIVISTKDTDYIIDAIKLKHELLLLTELFINPKIVKIMIHSKRMLLTIQQKLHLYFVNVFDVATAYTALNETSGNFYLHAVLKKEYNVESRVVNKPDYRQRPLPEEYKTHVRLGTRYLIHIYHVYKNRLITKDPDLYKKFLEDCRNFCKLMYSDSKSDFYPLLEKTLKNHHDCELEVLKKLSDWRVGVANRVNIYPKNVIPDAGLVKMAQTLPTDVSDILEINQSAHVRREMAKIQKMIEESRMKFSIITKQKKTKAQKRKLTNQQQMNTKKKMLEQTSNRDKNLDQRNVFQRRQSEDLGSTPNKNQDSSYNKKQPKQNKNFNPPNFNKKQSKQFNKNALNLSLSPFNKRNRNPQPFQQSGSRFQDLFSSTNPNNMNTSNSALLLNPTNVPSAFTFQSNARMNSSFNEFGASNSSFLPFTNQDNGSGFQQGMQMAQNNFDQTLNDLRQLDTNDQDSMYKTLVDLKQARDSIRTQAGKYRGSFGAGRLQDLNIIDQKISMLEIKLQQMRRGNNNRDKFYNNKKRYFH